MLSHMDACGATSARPLSGLAHLWRQCVVPLAIISTVLWAGCAVAVALHVTQDEGLAIGLFVWLLLNAFLLTARTEALEHIRDELLPAPTEKDFRRDEHEHEHERRGDQHDCLERGLTRA